MSRIIKIGTRKSKLAIAQTQQVVRELKEIDATLEIELVPMSTQGDRTLDQPLESFGGKGAFISEFEDAMIKGQIDLAVHSAKDMPMILPDKLSILGVSQREDARDVIVYRREGIHSLHSESVVGTSSLRRKLQLERNYLVQIKNLRGNINTRLAKLQNLEYDAIVLASAGLKRLDFFESEEFYLQKWNNITSTYSLETEREVIRLLNSGCNEPVGVYSTVEHENIVLRIFYKFNNKIYKICDKSKIEDRLKLAKEMVSRIYQ